MTSTHEASSAINLSVRGNVLQISAGGGWPRNEYRVRAHMVEFRSLLAPHPLQNEKAGWRILTSNELALHFNLQTLVAAWLRSRIAGSADVVPA